MIDADVLVGMLPLGNRHGAGDSGMKIELARRTQFDYMDELLVGWGKPDEPLSASWAHVEGRIRIIERYEDLYNQFPPGVRHAAARGTYYRQGRKHLEKQYWSAAAVRSFARAAYHAPDERAEYVKDALVSLFGRPGLRAVDALG